MKWNKFGIRLPELRSEVLYFDGSALCIAYYNENGQLFPESYYCNKKTCKTKTTECGCALTVTPHHYWAKVPLLPGDK